MAVSSREVCGSNIELRKLWVHPRLTFLPAPGSATSLRRNQSGPAPPPASHRPALSARPMAIPEPEKPPACMDGHPASAPIPCLRSAPPGGGP